jgi:hypothetical protein
MTTVSPHLVARLQRKEPAVPALQLDVPETDATMAPASSASRGDGAYASHMISGSLLRAAVEHPDVCEDDRPGAGSSPLARRIGGP